MAKSGRAEAVAAALGRLFPRLPARDLRAILDRALASKGLKTASPEAAAWLSAVSYARHTRTEYDTLLTEDYDVDSARHFTLEALNEALAEWGSRKRIE